MKKTNTRRSLAMSLVSMLVCFTMLVGTTFAWFTDSVTNDNNVIKTGKLEVGMYWADGTAEPAAAEYKDAKSGAIFGHTNWEPGFSEARHIKITNEGTLALNYYLRVVPSGVVGPLADVIDVYYFATATALERADVTTGQHLGTLAQVMGTEQNLAKTVKGNLVAGASTIHTLVLVMQSTAGDEYQDTSLGCDFSVELIATQMAYEKDSFDNQYDKDATYITSVRTLDDFFKAVENGDNILLSETIAVNASFMDYMNARYSNATYELPSNGTVRFDKDAVIDGNGITIYRTADIVGKPMFEVANGYTLTLSNITVDGGAKWGGEIDPVLLRGTTNDGLTTTGTIITTLGNGSVTLNEGAVIQNNDGANAISLATRGKGTLTLNGGEIINNNGGASGAIWGGGNIVMNSGKLNGNYGGIGGVVRTVDGQSSKLVNITVNGGEIKNNKAQTGGVIWSGNNLNVYFNGGEIANNYSATGGGVIWGGSADKYVIAGNVEIHDNVAGELGNVIRMNHYKWPSLTISGGKIYNNNAESGKAAIYAINSPVTISGGYIDDDVLFTGGEYLTVGKAEILGTVHCSIALNVNQVKLSADFNGFKFTVDENASNFAAFNLKPATGYTYTEGDEEKLVCMNDGYTTYWDAAAGAFKIKAN